MQVCSRYRVVGSFWRRRRRIYSTLRCTQCGGVVIRNTPSSISTPKRNRTDALATWKHEDNGHTWVGSGYHLQQSGRRFLKKYWRLFKFIIIIYSGKQERPVVRQRESMTTATITNGLHVPSCRRGNPVNRHTYPFMLEHVLVASDHTPRVFNYLISALMWQDPLPAISRTVLITACCVAEFWLTMFIYWHMRWYDQHNVYIQTVKLGTLPVTHPASQNTVCEVHLSTVTTHNSNYIIINNTDYLHSN